MSSSDVREHVPAWRRLVRALTAIEITIGAICLLLIASLVFFQALQRYLPMAQVSWTGEVSQFCMVWLTFSVAGVLITSGGHITLEIVDSFKSRALVRVVQVIALVIVAAIGVTLVVEAVHLIQTQGIIKSPVLRMPMSWAYIPLLIGLISLVLRALILAGYVAARGPIIAEIDDEAEVLA